MPRTPSPLKGRARRGQRGFTLIEVMAAGIILSIFILGIGGLWRVSENRVTDLVVRQKAVFALNAEMERLTAMYAYTTFGDGGPVSTTYSSGGLLPETRLIYPTDVSPYIGGGASNDFITTSPDDFETGPLAMVYVDRSFWSYNNRAYVWIDRDSNVAGRLSWETSLINVLTCVGGDNCSCHDFDGTDSPLFKDYCVRLALYLEYPYRLQSDGEMAADSSRQTMSLKTIVGRL